MVIAMTIPDGISEIAWAAAVDATMGTMAFGSPRLTETIARAIQAAQKAEREVCALLIEQGFDRENVVRKTDECAHGRFGYEDCEQCAVIAIRSRKGA